MYVFECVHVRERESESVCVCVCVRACMPELDQETVASQNLLVTAVFKCLSHASVMICTFRMDMYTCA